MKELSNKFKELINNSSNIVITTHKGPDGDAIGSSLALYHLLIKLNKKVSVITPDNFPKNLKWINGCNKIIEFDSDNLKAIKITKNADLIIMLDFNTLDRLHNFKPYISKSNAIKVLIDHHQDPDLEIADLIFSNTNCSSTAELLFLIFNLMNFNTKITKDIAESLYTGIMTDTGSFRFPSTSSLTHEIISKLINKGARNARIYDKIYNSSSENRIKLLGYCLNEKLIIYKNHRSAIFSLSQKELNKFNFEKGDTEGIINYALTIKDIIFAAFIVEREGVVKLSLRSRGNFKVNEVAKKYFNGGGHINAAGGTSKLSLEETLIKMEKIIKLNTKKLKQINI